MKAVDVRALGGPEVLEFVDAPRPVPGPGEVLVRVHAVGVNPADWKLRRGAVDDAVLVPPFRLGLDFAGVVEETGEEVFGLVVSRWGAYAEYVAVPEAALAPKPASLDHVHAAALPTAVLTASQALAGVRAGQRVLIHAAAGGVGHVAVQIARSRGAHVIGTARAVNHRFLRELGADELIDHTAADFATQLSGVDVVLDLVGGDYGTRSLRVLRPDGVLLDAVGGTAGDATRDPRHRRFRVRPEAGDLARDAAGVRVHVERVLPLADAARAHELSENGRVRGKIVLTP